MRVPTPRLYLGTMTFGWAGQTSSVVDEAVSLEMTQMFINHCKETSSSSSPSPIHIDTARIYSSGTTESILGSVLRQIQLPSSSSGSGVIKENIIVGSKVHPSWEDGGLSPHGIRSSFRKSMHEINNNNNNNDNNDNNINDISINSFGEYYLHQPDTKHPLLESLRCIHELVSDGLIQSFGMSNYHATEMKRAFEICHEHGLTKPTVCQSLYNPLNRAVERELIPLLNANGCSFVAYNPLAAGLLTGKHQKSASKSKLENDNDDKNDDGVKQGRFKNNPNYLPRFYTDANFDAVEIIKQACDKENITLVDATFKWLLRHSALGPNDGILLGASSAPQLQQNLDACRSATEEGGEGHLSDDVLAAFDAAAKITEKGVFPYWRSYSEDMPGREGMDEGASYSGAKQK